MKLKASERLARRTVRRGDCLIWTGAATRKGYGTVTFRNGRKSVTKYAHRIAYELAKGEIPAGMVIDHLCRTPACVNPEHLEAVTPQENNRRSDSLSAVAARRDCCAKGHPYNEENLRVTASGARQCRVCDRENAWRRRHHGEADSQAQNALAG